jgi:hypothetical protein
MDYKRKSQTDTSHDTGQEERKEGNFNTNALKSFGYT